ncbi:MAG: GCG_CRPN prefix-to-repeats domain-containing protein [Bradyrhizobium sp.]
MGPASASSTAIYFVLGCLLWYFIIGIPIQLWWEAWTLIRVITLASIGVAHAADGCGPGCHATQSGACVVDGWGTGARIWN